MIIFPDKLRACNNPKPTLVITQEWGTMDKWTIDLSASFIPFSVQKQGNFAVIGKKRTIRWALRGVLKRRFSSYFWGDNQGDNPHNRGTKGQLILHKGD